MAKRKRPKMTPEEYARRAQTQRMLRERIAYHEAKARELGEWDDFPPLPPVEPRRPGKMTAEERALRAANQRLLRQRVAYREARAREEEERRARET
jgi:hypothetical protein